MWETLIFGTGDWFAFGEPFFCGLFTPTYPLPGHRLVPESQSWALGMPTQMQESIDFHQMPAPRFGKVVGGLNLLQGPEGLSPARVDWVKHM